MRLSEMIVEAQRRDLPAERLPYQVRRVNSEVSQPAGLNALTNKTDGSSARWRSRLSRAMRLSGVVLALVVASAARGSAQPSLPPLPSVDLKSYSALAREAVSAALQLATSQPTDAAAVGALGRVLQAWEQLDAAHQAYARAEALAPRTFEWRYLDAVVLQRLARHDEAARQLEFATADAPDYLPARVRLAEALFDAGDLDRSRRLFDALRGERPAAPQAEYGLGRIDAAGNRQAAAILHFERAIALFPEWGAAHYALAQAY